MTNDVTSGGLVSEFFEGGLLHRTVEDGTHVMRAWPNPVSRIQSARGRWQKDFQQADRYLRRLLWEPPSRPPVEPPKAVELPPIPDTPEIRKVLAMFGGEVEDPSRIVIEKQNRDAYSEWRRNHDVLDFLETIPADIREIVRCYSEGHWRILNFLAHCPGADEMHASNPALFYMLADIREARGSSVKHPVEAAKYLLRRPQRQALGWFGFPPTETVRKSLAKMLHCVFGAVDVCWLRGAMQCPGIQKMLGHLQRINVGAVTLVIRPELNSYLTPRLLADIAHDESHDKDSNIDSILNDAIFMSSRVDGMKMPSSFTSVADIYQIHDELLRRCHLTPDEVVEQMLSGVREDTLPAPPFRGTEDVVPIQTVGGLYMEGAEMEHCAGFLSAFVLQGNSYVFKVMAPVRATAEIVRHHQSWKIKQVQGFHNAKISTQIIKQVEAAIFG
jgi:hypothetical protein